MKVSELSGALLDYWVARCEMEGQLSGHELRRKAEGVCLIVDLSDDQVVGYICEGIRGRYRARKDWNLVNGEWCYQPSSDWAFGGPIIERERFNLIPSCGDAGSWFARDVSRDVAIWHFGPTVLVAAMRVFVASRFGTEVPDEVPA
ncbi:phage protein NinX family protein [Burkholderia glumae]|uniref:phage protein NinX family protein n=1 Tax=Burkholderia glumae TaxID=337 RepID=UPI0020CCB9A8|nr:phage protein NinX family protein [Burkholderia glumae]MCQ0032562.1 DUF2591 domain-containing protein [Burkholderia glumae]MCQ0035800.1 DUF2591 domain-containing protein [Burkholderia glumae]